MFQRYGVIYKITNLVTNKCYIGKTKTTIQLRWADHKKPSAMSCSILKRAIKKYGSENFRIEEVVTCFSKDDLNETEKLLIKQFNVLHPNGYNLREGGEGGEFTEISRKKLSESLKGKKKRPHTEEEKLHLSRVMTGRVFSKETRLKMSKASKGRQIPKNHPNSSTPITSYNLENKQIIEYPSIAEANRQGFDSVSLNRVLKNKLLFYKNCLWFYKENFSNEALSIKIQLIIKKFSKLKGNKKDKNSTLFQARIKVNNKQVSLGYFKTPQEAWDRYRLALLDKFTFLKSLIDQFGWVV